MRRRVSVGLVGLVVVLGLAGDLRAAPEKVTVKVEGLTSSGCSSPASVKGTMERIEGVARADVNAERGEAVVEFDPSRVDLAQLVAKVERYCLVKMTPPSRP
jgi:copper chaperone CopZ